MDGASFQFVVFGLLVAILSNLSRSRLWRSGVLMLASAVFLGLLARNPLVLLPLAGFLAVGYAGLVLIERGFSKSAIWSILAVVATYILLKKYTFLPERVLLHSPYFTLGLSYIFFRVLHLLIEAKDGRQTWRIGPASYLLYMLNFTTLISGPIQRYDEFARDQFAPEPIRLGTRVIGSQLERIVRGFFKVTVLGVLFHAVQQDALAQIARPPSAQPMRQEYFAFLLLVTYPLFLYSNFSGYIDIVIGLARLMRLRLPENFNRPFAASSFLDFWNRWHMTLSNWLKTYVYNPLLMALMRRFSSVTVEPLLGVFCFFVTFFLIGVWHGRTSEFICFGFLDGAGVSINRLWQLGLARAIGRKTYKELASNPISLALGRGLNFVWFAFTLFWFWADWKQIHSIFAALSVPQWLAVWLTAWLIMTAVLAFWEWLRSALLSVRTSEGPVLASRYARVVYASAQGLAALGVNILLNQPAPDIVYKAF